MNIKSSSNIALKLIAFVCLVQSSMVAQGGFHFGAKGGFTLANQTWNEGERRMLRTYHGNLFVETRDINERGGLYASLGIHTRGSSIRSGFLIGGGLAENGYKFQNVSLQFGARKRVASQLSVQPYYLVGLRVEYTVDNNLLELTNCFNSPQGFFCSNLNAPEFINKFNYGLSFGGGFEFQGGEFFTPCIEFSIHPDASFQYERRGSIPTNVGILPEALVRNISFEVSLVLKFLREVIYSDR